ncbi:MAG TPA: hypothetical protein VJQ53_06890 [Candidatus Eisenbacteria bacterium]|nr:hypothetical protein [Candidatus Eisenbacteria bacterium]
MNCVFFDSPISEELRRERLYDGEIFVFSPRATSRALCDFARELTEQAFKPLDPRDAQYSLPVEQYAAILGELKPRFIHHPRSKELLRALLEDFSCDLTKTYFDVPRLRTATHGGYLTAGIAYAFHPHRDTWYSAPFCQLNWWLPVYDIVPDNALAFHPRYWRQSLRNGSARYNYAEWVRESRKNAAQHVKEDTRDQPRPEEPVELEPQLRLICPPGGLLIFSAAQLHSTVPNTSGRTRFSIDFRTVHLDDVAAGTGAPNVDSACTGTTMGDYLRGTDLSHISGELIDRYEREPAAARLEPPRTAASD